MNHTYKIQFRHANYYKDLAWKTEEDFLQGRGRAKLALQKFDTEWANIAAGQRWAADHLDSTAAAELCLQYAAAGVVLREFRQPVQEQLRWLEMGIRAARRRKNRTAYARHLSNLCRVYVNIGEARRAVKCYQRALAIARKNTERLAEAEDLWGLGQALTELGEFPQAIECLEASLKILREIGDRLVEGSVLHSLGVAYDSQGEMARAIDYFQEAVLLADEFGDGLGKAQTLKALSSTYESLGEGQKAAGVLYSAMALLHEY